MINSWIRNTGLFNSSESIVNYQLNKTLEWQRQRDNPERNSCSAPKTQSPLWHSSFFSYFSLAEKKMTLQLSKCRPDSYNKSDLDRNMSDLDQTNGTLHHTEWWFSGASWIILIQPTSQLDLQATFGSGVPIPRHTMYMKTNWYSSGLPSLRFMILSCASFQSQHMCTKQSFITIITV